jgi:hypothetical protein
LQTCMYINSLMRWVTFVGLPLSSYALSPTRLPATVGNFAVEQLSVPSSHFWMSSTYRNLRPRRRTIFANSHKSFGAKSREKGGCSTSLIDFWVRNCLTALCELEHCHGGESNRWAKVQAFFYAYLHVTPSTLTV